MVTGGIGSSSSRLDTTEVFKDGAWIVSAGKMPIAITNLDGTTISNRAMVFGKNYLFLMHFSILNIFRWMDRR